MSKMRSKGEFLSIAHKLWGEEQSLNVRILTLEALLDIRDILDKRLWLETHLVNKTLTKED